MYLLRMSSERDTYIMSLVKCEFKVACEVNSD